MSNRTPPKRSSPKPSPRSFSTESAEYEKVAAVCTACGEIYAAERKSDGTIRPIGRKDGCQCGSADFEMIEGSDEKAPATSKKSDH